MLNVTINSLLECTASTRDLVYDLVGQFEEAVEALRTVRGDKAAEAFLQMIRNMDDAGAFSVKECGEDD